MNKKIKVLLTNEFSQLNTGYSVYGRELLNRLYDTNKYEIAEHAAYCQPGDPRLFECRWKVYPNVPPNNVPQSEMDNYLSTPTNQFGQYLFNDVCLDFEPDIVLNICDPWQHEFIFTSPYRNLYKLAVMPTVDSKNISPSWIAMYQNADNIATYSKFGKQILEQESNYSIKVSDIIRPGFDKENFSPVENRIQLRKDLNLPIPYNSIIVGTVMRNQKRKLFDDLFLSLRKYLDIYNEKDVYLYCHTSYPDMGFNIPKLLKEHRVANRVLFTYVCTNCRNILPSFFSDIERHCPYCHGKMVLPKTQVGATNKQLGQIYNLMDVYAQYSISEGFGIPQVEAAACGTKVMSTDFSAMEDVVRVVGGQPIPIERYFKEVETNFIRAYPNNTIFVELLHDFLSSYRKAEDFSDSRTSYSQNQMLNIMSYYENWDSVAKKWESIIDNLSITESKWNKVPPFIWQPKQINPNIPNSQFVEHAIANITGKPELINTFIGQKFLRDLNYGAKVNHFGGLSYNDETFFGQQFKHKEYNRDMFVQDLLQLTEQNNKWEQKRLMKLQGKYQPSPLVMAAKPNNEKIQ